MSLSAEVEKSQTFAHQKNEQLGKIIAHLKISENNQTMELTKLIETLETLKNNLCLSVNST
ncbi:hypothetical protein OAG24_00720 [bacterium]|nr:hypothetical protein [bacterium]